MVRLNRLSVRSKSTGFGCVRRAEAASAWTSSNIDEMSVGWQSACGHSCRTKQVNSIVEKDREKHLQVSVSCVNISMAWVSAESNPIFASTSPMLRLRPFFANSSGEIREETGPRNSCLSAGIIAWIDVRRRLLTGSALSSELADRFIEVDSIVVESASRAGHIKAGDIRVDIDSTQSEMRVEGVVKGCGGFGRKQPAYPKWHLLSIKLDMRKALGPGVALAGDMEIR